jgi:hypothetical protein
VIDLFVARLALEAVAPSIGLFRANQKWLAKPFTLDGAAVASDAKGVLLFDGLADALGIVETPPDDARADVLRRAVSLDGLDCLGVTTLRKLTLWAGRNDTTLDEDGNLCRPTRLALVGPGVVDAAALAVAIWPLALAGDESVRVLYGSPFPPVPGVPPMLPLFLFVGDGWRFGRMAATPCASNMPGEETRLALDPEGGGQ